MNWSRGINLSSVKQAKSEVLIVGGGPAGGVLAIRLARAGCRVTLLERSEYSQFRVGECLSPATVPRLIALGIWENFLETQPLPAYGIQSVWGSDILESSSFLPQAFQNGWRLDRQRFDEMLSSAAEDSGARVCRRTRSCAVRQGVEGVWEVDADSPDGTSKFHADFIVDATGRSARLCSELGIEMEREDNLLGIGGLALGPSNSEPLPSLVESHPLGWWYSSEIPGHRVIVIFFTDSDLCKEHGLARPECWFRLLEESPHTFQRLSGYNLARSLQTFIASSQRPKRVSCENWLAIGDAAVARDPLSSSGIDFAFASAERAFAALASLVAGNDSAMATYNADVRADFVAYLEQRRAYYQLETRWTDEAFWQRRHQRNGTTTRTIEAE